MKEMLIVIFLLIVFGLLAKAWGNLTAYCAVVQGGC